MVTLKKYLLALVEMFASYETSLNRLDSALSCGDFGTRMSACFATISENIKDYDFNNPKLVINDLCTVVSQKVKGQIGIILTNLLMQFNSELLGDFNQKQICLAFYGAINTVRNEFKIRSNYKSFFSVLSAAAAAASVNYHLPLVMLLEIVKKEATIALDQVTQSKAHVGRGNYLGKRSVGIKDAGAVAMHASVLCLYDLVLKDTEDPHEAQ